MTWSSPKEKQAAAVLRKAILGPMAAGNSVVDAVPSWLLIVGITLALPRSDSWGQSSLIQPIGLLIPLGGVMSMRHQTPWKMALLAFVGGAIAAGIGVSTVVVMSAVLGAQPGESLLDLALGRATHLSTVQAIASVALLFAGSIGVLVSRQRKLRSHQ
jgi:hypothetical protein